MKTAEIVKIYEKKIWIEGDFFGNKHVMIQHQDGESEPFTYCTFNYDHRYTCNSIILDSAEKMAIDLGASEPVERQTREFKLAPPNAIIQGPRSGPAGMEG